MFFGKGRSLHHPFPTHGEKWRKPLIFLLPFTRETNLLLFSQEAKQEHLLGNQSSPHQMLLIFLLLAIMSGVPEIPSGVGVTALNCPTAESFLLLLLRKVSYSTSKQDFFSWVKRSNCSRGEKKEEKKGGGGGKPSCLSETLLFWS